MTSKREKIKNIKETIPNATQGQIGLALMIMDVGALFANISKATCSYNSKRKPHIKRKGMVSLRDIKERKLKSCQTERKDGDFT